MFAARRSRWPCRFLGAPECAPVAGPMRTRNWGLRGAEGAPAVRAWRVGASESTIAPAPRAAQTGDSAISIEYAVLIALVQGFTEFAPVSSSAHLILIPSLTGSPDQGLLIDVAAHAGTLAAVITFFRLEVARMARGALQLARGDFAGADARLALVLAIGTAPAVLVGAGLRGFGASESLRGIEPIGWFTIIFGVLLYLADRFGRQRVALSELGVRDAALVGLAQALAFLPGASRAGVVMSAARGLGYDRESAARFAFLLAIPTIGAATILGAFELARVGDIVLWEAATGVFSLAYLAAMAALWALIRYVRRWSLTPFVVYRLALGAALLWYAYGSG